MGGGGWLAAVSTDICTLILQLCAQAGASIAGMAKEQYVERVLAGDGSIPLQGGRFAFLVVNRCVRSVARV